MPEERGISSHDLICSMSCFRRGQCCCFCVFLYLKEELDGLVIVVELVCGVEVHAGDVVFKIGAGIDFVSYRIVFVMMEGPVGGFGHM